MGLFAELLELLRKASWRGCAPLRRPRQGVGGCLGPPGFALAWSVFGGHTGFLELAGSEEPRSGPWPAEENVQRVLLPRAPCPSASQCRWPPRAVVQQWYRQQVPC